MTYPFVRSAVGLNEYGKCITIFSAANYCDSTGNKGAILRFGHDLKPHFETVGIVSVVECSLTLCLIPDLDRCTTLRRCFSVVAVLCLSLRGGMVRFCEKGSEYRFVLY